MSASVLQMESRHFTIAGGPHQGIFLPKQRKLKPLSLAAGCKSWASEKTNPNIQLKDSRDYLLLEIPFSNSEILVMCN